jgi:ZIP family zinc transporter/zinc and cadmium transporter
MSSPLTPILLAVVAACAAVAGGVMVTSRGWAQSTLRYFIAGGAGFMLGAVFLEMLPESIVLSQNALAWVLGGYLIVHMFEHTFAAHLHFGEETHHEEMEHRSAAVSALLGLLVHTFFDGVAIGAGFGVSARTGSLVFLAVLLHKIPDGFTVASIAITSGFSRRVALGTSVLLGVSTVTGVLAVVLIGQPSYALAISAGTTLYVAASDLMPEVNRDPGVKLALLVFAGVGLFLLAGELVH